MHLCTLDETPLPEAWKLNYPHIAQKARNVLRGLVQRHAPAFLKRRLWNDEFARGQWDFLDDTGDPFFHLEIEDRANNGSILDLGCGTGTTGLELDPNRYTLYVGVDISDRALRKARQRVQNDRRADRNQYVQSDIMNYVPSQKFNVILFGESIYYVPTRQISTQLTRYSRYLQAGGSFVARMFDVTDRRLEILGIIERNFEIVKKELNHQTRAITVVFKPVTIATSNIEEISK